MVETAIKRKRPPTFQHLPVKRAKKLKQTWVQNVKIKTKWKAQKRKEATFATLSHPAAQDEYDNNAEVSDSDGSKRESEDEESVPQESTLHPSRAHVHIHPELVPKTTLKPQRAEKLEKNEPPASSPSLRDLTREAYSRSSLHTFKADPLHRRRGSQPLARGGKSRGRGAPSGERGRGQPNMKLRMDAILEKIRRDLT
ncbi:hypothetical protein BDZ94DRAFT_214685 [Collybia nuda]|uniref:Uncharacterized protein n=1 Tax=Collybia nuda TaxID=64659 RepID=A0A9P6CMX1_9AGAR|nr:hypothetical protein BDZ94DRAFT_214685 [Collybia nuda]